jgi:hypothetical protein
MSDDFPRRRRLTPDGPRRSSGGPKNINPWLVTILAAVVVIIGGWFIGQGLAHALGPNKQTAQNQMPTPTPVITPVASPEPSPTQEPTPVPSPSATAAPSPSAVPTQAPTVAPKVAAATPAPTATPQPTPAPTAAPTQAPTPAPVATPQPKPVRTAVPRTTLPVARKPEATPAPASENAAARTVRAYIDALKSGDPQSAAMYLGNGSPDESFINGNTHINSITSTPNGDGSYKVAVDMKTSAGEYYETFTVAETGNGARILDKTAIKP